MANNRTQDLICHEKVNMNYTFTFGFKTEALHKISILNLKVVQS